MITENIQKIIIGGLGIILLVIVLFFMLPALMRGEGNITIQSAPAGAKVLFEGKTYDSPAKLANIAAGSHKVELSKEGYKKRVDEVRVEKGKSTKITLRLYSREISPTAVRAGLDDVSKIKSDLEKIADYLPFGNEKYRIELVSSGRKPTIKITLYAIFNRDSQYSQFNRDLKAFSKEALDWIRSKGADPENLDIKWEPVNPDKF